VSVRRKQRGPEVFRITGARQGLAEDVRGRERRYVISMLVRTVAVLLTVFLWNVQRPLAVITLVLGATLPYVAVVIANGGRENAPSLPDSYIATPPRTALGPAEHTPEEHAEGPEGRTVRQTPWEGRTVRQPPWEPDRPADGHGPEPSRSGPDRQD